MLNDVPFKKSKPRLTGTPSIRARSWSLRSIGRKVGKLAIEVRQHFCGRLVYRGHDRSPDLLPYRVAGQEHIHFIEVSDSLGTASLGRAPEEELHEKTQLDTGNLGCGHAHRDDDPACVWLRRLRR